MNEICFNLACQSSEVVVRAWNPEFQKEVWYCRDCWESQIEWKRQKPEDVREVLPLREMEEPS